MSHAFYTMPFRQFGANTTISASGTTASGALARSSIQQSAVVTNPHATSTAFVTFGASDVEATEADFPVGPGMQSILSVPEGATHAAVILDADTGDVYVSVGDGTHV